MPTFSRPGVSISYTDHGEGFPILLIAPGGMRSAASFWEKAPWDPRTHLVERGYRVIAMDQRNAGESTAEVHASDGWPVYTADQLALLDHLGVTEFAVFGMCIGGGYTASLLVTAPERIRAAVTLQPTGRENNQHRFEEMFDGWRDEIADDHPEASAETWDSFRHNMFAGGGILFSVPDEALARIATPWLVLMGGDEFHPEAVSRTLTEVAPGAQLVERWKADEYVADGRAAVDDFLATHL
ncbi:alpha/beta fold hydrolase [Pseudonocardia phyllosphaerae]|uniref:alpha/beta fold hydrolase n=1 Tax=Pseudonocardia phyllosphaerae TaxID=3390502 RepID=UPI0039785A6E